MRRTQPNENRSERAERLSGKIVEWQPERGFGYVESEGHRIFLHFREFAERHKKPEVGDAVTFVLGVDRQGRTCARQAVHVNDGGSFTVLHAFGLALLMFAPAAALWRATDGAVFYLSVACWIGFSVITYFAYAWDKQSARAKGRREPERTLHLLELIGGWPGALVAQFRLRHKSSKITYQFLFWLIVTLHQLVAIDYVRGWPMLQQVKHEIFRGRR